MCGAWYIWGNPLCLLPPFVLAQCLSAWHVQQVAMVGSGAWACAAVRMLAQSAGVDDPAAEFDDEVRMWWVGGAAMQLLPRPVLDCSIASPNFAKVQNVLRQHVGCQYSFALWLAGWLLRVVRCCSVCTDSCMSPGCLRRTMRGISCQRWELGLADPRMYLSHSSHSLGTCLLSSTPHRLMDLAPMAASHARGGTVNQVSCLSSSPAATCSLVSCTLQVINERHENPKYLPGVALGENVKAVTSLEETIKDADCIVLCSPHQFVHRWACKHGSRLMPVLLP